MSAFWKLCARRQCGDRGGDETGIDLVVRGKEPLSLAGRFELLHLPLSSACRLVRILGSVVQSLVLAMLKDGHDLPLRRVVAGKLVGVMTRGGRICFFSSLRSSCFAACLSRRRLALDQNVEDDAGLVHGSPQPMLHPGNFARDLMKMPFVANPGKAATDLIGEPLAEFACPLPHGF